MSEKTYRDIKVEKMPASQVKIIGEITETAFESARKAAIENAKKVVEIPGFRAGKAPENLVLQHVGEMKILENAAEAAINDAYSKILDDEKLRAIGMPAVSITKLAVGNPLGFTIVTAVMPNVELGDYRKISKEVIAKIPEANTSVEEKDIDAVIDEIKKHFNSQLPADAEGKKKEIEFNDEFVRGLGEFPDVATFRKKTGENIIENRKHEVIDKRRATIADQLIAESKFEIPEVIVESELEQMINQFRADVERSGFTFEQYLEQIKKTEAEIRKEWRESAERRARLELILKNIARAEKIELPEAEVKHEMEHILSHHKDADRFRVRMYVENIMTNKKVFELLENL